MDANILYIIGNGFDIYHGIKSKYNDFKKYLEKDNTELLEKLDEYFNSVELWSDFEKSLANLDTDKILDEASMFYESYGTEDWSDAYHHDYQYEIQNRINIVTVELKSKFLEWILQLEIENFTTGSKIIIKPDSIFLNFNYTKTLEKLYRINENRILYIHNKAIDKNSILILGHGRNPKESKSFYELNKSDDQDPRGAEGDQILDSYISETYKPTKIIIKDKMKFFKQLNTISEIYIFGHSLSNIDFGYFQEIVKNIEYNKVKWKVSYFRKDELEYHKEFFNKLGIKSILVDFGIIQELSDTYQLNLFTNFNYNE